MIYYWFNKQEILQKAKEKYSKEKAAQYYLKNKQAIKEKSREPYKNLSQEEKGKIKEYQRKRYQKLVQSRSFLVRHLVDACLVRMFIFLSFNEDAALIR